MFECLTNLYIRTSCSCCSVCSWYSVELHCIEKGNVYNVCPEKSILSVFPLPRVIILSSCAVILYYVQCIATHRTATHRTATHLLSHGLNKLGILMKRGPQLSLLTNLHQVKSYTYVWHTLRYRCCVHIHNSTNILHFTLASVVTGGCCFPYIQQKG